MIGLKAAARAPRLPEWSSRNALLYWLRAVVPDIEIRHAKTEHGARACGARFTLGGEHIEVEAIESPDVPDPDDTIVRRCAWIVHQRMGLARGLPAAERLRFERAVIEASMRGDENGAAALGQQLAVANEGVGARRPTLASRFERWGRSMFKDDGR